MTIPETRAACLALDRSDPLATRRELFTLPGGVIYLDGNSLGALPKAVAPRLAEAVARDWGQNLITSWNAAGWIDLPRRAGEKIGRLIGAAPGETIVTDSTSVNLYKVLAAALAMRPDRRVIVSERGNFPTDLYIAEGAIRERGSRHDLRLVDNPGEIPTALDDDLAVLMLTHVDYRSGRIHDMAGLTRQVHAKGGLVIWDLAHSAGALPLEIAAANADFAIGCGYKYLNGGPGAPAFLWVPVRHHAEFRQPLAGWFGHARPFAFEPGYAPAAGIDRALCGTPAVLAMMALDAALDVWDGIDMAAVRRKSMALTGLFIAHAERRARGLVLQSPRDPAIRGSQVSFAVENGYAIMQALIARGVIGDFRAPDTIRFGFTPLYTRFVDAWDAAEHIADILATRAWDRPEFHRRAAVT